MRTQPIVLTEYEKRSFPRDEIDPGLGEFIFRNYKGRIKVEFPSPKTNDSWEFQSLGYVGIDCLDGDVELQLGPRNSIAAENLFRMVDVVYDLPDEPGLVSVASVGAYFDKWALHLGRKILMLIRSGLYKAYVDMSDDLRAIRGRIDLARAFAHPERLSLPCNFQELTPDVEENRILAGALSLIIRHPACSQATFEVTKKASRGLLSVVTDLQTDPSACVGRLYSRLNSHYEPLHALARLFLENSGPSHLAGTRSVTPFLIDTETLFERYIEKTVTRLLAAKFPNRWVISPQHRLDVGLGAEEGRVFKVDLLLKDRKTGKVEMVLETKSVPTSVPRTDDLEQVVAYAARADASEAVLIYPSLEIAGYAEPIGSYIRARALTFALDGDLETTAEDFVGQLLEPIL